jgi:hypothetical protein
MTGYVELIGAVLVDGWREECVVVSSVNLVSQAAREGPSALPDRNAGFGRFAPASTVYCIRL